MYSAPPPPPPFSRLSPIVMQFIPKTAPYHITIDISFRQSHLYACTYSESLLPIAPPPPPPLSLLQERSKSDLASLIHVSTVLHPSHARQQTRLLNLTWTFGAGQASGQRSGWRTIDRGGGCCRGIQQEAALPAGGNLPPDILHQPQLPS